MPLAIDDQRLEPDGVAKVKLEQDVIERRGKQPGIKRRIELSAGLMAIVVHKIEDLAIAKHLLGIERIAIVTHAEDDARGFE